MNRQRGSSRLSGFYKKSLVDRAAVVAQWAGLTSEEQAVFFGLSGLSLDAADHMIENVIGLYALPMGVATNFQINGKDYLIPMVVEEPSIVAGVSNSAKIIRDGGGFQASSTDPIMIGQMQVLDIDDVWQAAERIHRYEAELLEAANLVDGLLVSLGGGARRIETRPFPETAIGSMLIVHLLVDVRDAMGANVINTMCERLSPRIEQITGGRVKLRILSNLADQRTASATCRVKTDSLTTEELSGAEVVDSIVEATVFAEVDPYRATTHNKGVMNGIDAVALATGNDWRAIEAGAHSYVAREGRYDSMTRWWKDENGDLRGDITLPMAVGMVGGATRSHPVARVALKILGVENSREMAQVFVAVGLAQNLAAIRALATVGIQQGHMSLHARQIAMAAGAKGEQISRIADIMVQEKNIRIERAQELLKEMRS